MKLTPGNFGDYRVREGMKFEFKRSCNRLTAVRARRAVNQREERSSFWEVLFLERSFQGFETRRVDRRNFAKFSSTRVGQWQRKLTVHSEDMSRPSSGESAVQDRYEYRVQVFMTQGLRQNSKKSPLCLTERPKSVELLLRAWSPPVPSKRCQ